MHMLDIYIVVLPALHIAGVRPNPLDFFSLVAIGSAPWRLYFSSVSGTHRSSPHAIPA